MIVDINGLVRCCRSSSSVRKSFPSLLVCTYLQKLMIEKDVVMSALCSMRIAHST